MMGIKLAGLGGSAAAAALLVFAGPAAAQVQQQTYRFDVPAQNLGGALRVFGQASRQQIIFAEDDVRGKTSPALVGSFTADEGLQRLLAGSGLSVRRTAAGVIYVGRDGAASAGANASAAASQEVAEVLVTGSRIPRTSTSTAAPVTILDDEAITERGYVNLGEMLNQVTSNVPSFPISVTSGFPAGSGATSPNLFNLGAGRTLTLLNGRRMVTSSSGLGDRTVDTNVIPTGLIQRVDIVQAGGAAVYGSDAIAGVVNYILKDSFEGLELDAQYGESTKGDYPRTFLRATWGKNFAEGRGNIAVDLEYSKTRPLLEYARRRTAEGPRNVPNLANRTTTDGIPPTVWVFNGHFWSQNYDGVIFQTNTSLPTGLLRLNGGALQFSPGGQVIPYDTGLIQGTSSTAIGGQGLDVRENSTLAAGVERWNGTVIGRYDLTDSIRLSGELLVGRQEGRDPYGTQQIFRTAGSNAVAFNRNNPFLSAQDIATLSAASPTFAAGGNLFVSRRFNILPTRERYSRTETFRGLVALDGDFAFAERNFNWSLSYSRAETDGTQRVWTPNVQTIDRALNATRNAAGQIVCSINADANPANDDPRCVPLNPFGSQTASQEAILYVSVLQGQNYKNTQDAFLAVMSGDVINLPAGPAKFSVSYEHRAESVAFRPFEADLRGLTTTGTAPINRDGEFNTDEFAGELLVPVLGGDFTLPFVEALEFSGSYRFVDHSLAGKEEVWGVGGRWEVGYGLSFRASKSRNFRAPTLDQLFAPTFAAPGNPIGTDPCDADRINGGPAPATRLANCQAEWARNPGYDPLVGFQDPAENTGLVTITSGGNPNLRNELSETVTWGISFQPSYIPGLTFTADRIQVDLTDGLSAFTPASFLATCYDSSPQPADICATFQRNAMGHIIAARQTTFNAGKVLYRGEVYNFSYRFPIGRFFDDADFGTLEIAAEATHTTRLLTSVTGFDSSRSDGTTATPDWRVRGDLRYSKGPLRLFYSVYYLPSVKAAFTDTIETNPIPVVKANYTHTISAAYEWENYTFRAGVNNLTNEMPSFPTRTYGDIFGRQFFVGVRARY
ncbi:TonB-dependent receptor [Phenylobacterium sp. SCN 70-31]|uniref:TonB-dependent receptor n=1 Tax=Phenylobacterium sp. SCN 70-31 TaxID=1660129 RepID=UPI000AA9A46D|nr:TonB-dependent receptor [Phenylobacterium sp. SCN 70-31]